LCVTVVLIRDVCCKNCVQARPITTLCRATDDDIIHEFDSSLAMDREYLTTANIQSVSVSDLFSNALCHTLQVTVSK